MGSCRMKDQSYKDAPTTTAREATIFVVDDDAAVRRSLTRLLRSGAWNVESFSSASELLERSPLTELGCILLDVQMPGMNGLELQESLRQAGIALPVVFLTGRGDIPMSVRAMKQGAVDFLVKPVDKDVLYQALNQAINDYVVESAVRRNSDCIRSRLSLLSPREHEVLIHILRGRLNKQIASDMGIAEKTVKVHRRRVMDKLESGSLAELVHMCDLAGIEYAEPVVS